jgi:hypothetical protein
MGNKKDETIDVHFSLKRKAKRTNEKKAPRKTKVKAGPFEKGTIEELFLKLIEPELKDHQGVSYLIIRIKPGK